MKLLLFTQMMDTEDLYLGFMHGWVEEFAKHFEEIHVVCLKEGKHNLPNNVTVRSLGKERGDWRITRAWRVLKFSYELRQDYDAVFVHMNQEYILLAGWLWKRLKKPIYMWRNHYAGNKYTDRAVLMCKKVFYTSKFSYTAKSKNAVAMPVGVDTALYHPDPDAARDPRGVLFYARLAPSKNADVLIDALALLKERDVDFSADFYGTPLPEYEAYAEELAKKVERLGLQNKVRFLPGQPHSEGPKIFSSFAIFVNASRSGMYDKTLLEAAACECMVVAASKDFAELVPQQFIFEEGNAEDLTRKLEPLLTMPLLKQQGFGVQMRHKALLQDLPTLAKRLTEEIS